MHLWLWHGRDKKKQRETVQKPERETPFFCNIFPVLFMKKKKKDLTVCSLQKRVSWTVCLSCHQLNNEEYIGYERQYINNCLKDKCEINWQGQIILLIFLWKYVDVYVYDC